MGRFGVVNGGNEKARRFDWNHRAKVRRAGGDDPATRSAWPWARLELPPMLNEIHGARISGRLCGCNEFFAGRLEQETTGRIEKCKMGGVGRQWIVWTSDGVIW